MLPINTILHPTDFTQISEGALQLACVLARDYHAELVIVHVATESVIVSYEAGVPPILEDHKADLNDMLARLDVPVHNIKVLRLLEEGEPAEEILRTACLCEADLIVMGTHGRRGLSRLLAGSVAERVVREAPCPVITVKMPFASAEFKAAREETLAAAGR
jgi:nucleotide-binding universal stress UspA family protein